MTWDCYAASFWILIIPCWNQFLETVNVPPVSTPCKHHLCANQGSPICAKLCYGFAWPFACPFPQPQKDKASNFDSTLHGYSVFCVRLYSTLKPICEFSRPQNALTSFRCLNGRNGFYGRPRHLQLTRSQICGPGVQSCIDASHILPASAAKSNKVTIHDTSTHSTSFLYIQNLFPICSPALLPLSTMHFQKFVCTQENIISECWRGEWNTKFKDEPRGCLNTVQNQTAAKVVLRTADVRHLECLSVHHLPQWRSETRDNPAKQSKSKKRKKGKRMEYESVWSVSLWRIRSFAQHDMLMLSNLQKSFGLWRLFCI